MIGVGDKVMLVWGCCPAVRAYIGWVGVVDHIRSDDWTFCPGCFGIIHGTIAFFSHTEYGDGPLPVAWLKKMPPDGDPIEQREESEATA